MPDLLRWVWVVPFIPFVSFWLILSFGKGRDKLTSAIGITSVSACFALACLIGLGWIDRAESAGDGETLPAEITTIDVTSLDSGRPPAECFPVVVTHEEHEEEPAVDRAESAEGGTAQEPAADNEDAHSDASEEPAEGDHATDEEHAADEGHGTPGCTDAILDTSGEHQAGGTSGAEATDHATDGETAEAAGAGNEAHEPEVVAEAGHDAEAEGAGAHASSSAGPVIARTVWFTWSGNDYTVGTHLDGLSAMMLFVVTLISLLVHVYSTEYVKDDRRYTHYYAFLSLFTASMLFYVVSENFLQMLVGWELVGVCSFALIGHWWEDKANSDAALKAFLTNRVGDVGLLIGVIILFFAADAQTFSILNINELAASGAIKHSLLLVASLCLFAGVTSKSGQFPLHTWLPDAMAGPTPVSALIHAATMVVAGVYLIARLYPVFYEGLSMATGNINYVAVIGGFTTVMGGALAFAQKDIKKVLAYSTVSQLGYMVMALGVGAWTAAVFHVFTHAFFKAALFLGAGSLSHACHHSFNMVDDMGGLRKIMPSTFKTFVISSAALAGIVPLAGFWSKDEILAGAHAGQGGGQYTLMLVMGLTTAFLTAAYMGRAIYYAFFGEYRGHHHPHESPKTITVPLWILTFLAATVGFLNFPGEINGSEVAPSALAHRFQTWVEPTSAFAPVAHAPFTVWLAIVSTVLAVGGFTVAYLYFGKNLGPHGLTSKNGAARAGFRFLENKYYLDHLYEKIIRDGVKGPIAASVNWFNRNVLDGVVNGVGRLAVGTGRIVYRYIDQAVIDGAVNATGVASESSGQGLRRIQTGKIKDYGALLFGGALSIAGLFVLVVTNL